MKTWGIQSLRARVAALAATGAMALAPAGVAVGAVGAAGGTVPAPSTCTVVSRGGADNSTIPTVGTCSTGNGPQVGREQLPPGIPSCTVEILRAADLELPRPDTAFVTGTVSSDGSGCGTESAP